VTDRPALQHALRQFARAITRSAVADLLGTPDPLRAAQQQLDEAIDDVMDELDGVRLPNSASEWLTITRELTKEQKRYVA
jgi:hypothetical protein